jgi:hypothetical protein
LDHKICPKAIDPNFQTNQKESNLAHKENLTKSGQTKGETSSEISIDIVAVDDLHGVTVERLKISIGDPENVMCLIFCRSSVGYPRTPTLLKKLHYFSL